MAKPSEHNDKLGDKFYDYSVPPSEGLWEGIQASAGLKGGVASSFESYAVEPSGAVWSGIAATLHPNRKRIIAWWSTGAAAAVLVLLGSGLWFNAATGDSVGQTIAEYENGPRWESRENRESIVSNESPRKDARGNADNQKAMASNESPRKDARGNSMLKSKDAALLTYDLAQGEPVHFPWIPPMEEPTPVALDDDWALTASLSPFFNSPAASENGNVTSNIDPVAIFESTDETSMNAGLEYVGASMNVSDYAELNYRPPISFGGHVVALNSKRVGLGTGFQFTLLRGNALTEFGNLETRQSFSQQYLGFPLFAELKLIRKPKFSLYTRGGAQYDLGLKSTTTVEDIENGEVVNSFQSSFKPTNQVSAITGLGAATRINESFSLFFEGSANVILYQQGANLWSQRRVWPFGSFGLRYEL